MVSDAPDNLSAEATSTRRSYPGWFTTVCMLLGAACMAGIGFAYRLDRSDPAPTEPEKTIPTVRPASPQDPGLIFQPPIQQKRWSHKDDPSVYMPTGSGRVESAHYGSVRTNSRGQARFHEGVDISPVSQNKRGRAQDRIVAVADGKIVYIHRSPGGSSYGIYIVIAHEDPVGTVYTLYAHLASVTKKLKKGQTIKRGDELGIMGHSSSLGIPVQRSHLHLELVLKLNDKFTTWTRKEKRKNPHGNYHGFNLVGLNPHYLLQELDGKTEQTFSFLQALKREPHAWRILVKCRQRPEFFSRYPALWEEALPISGAVIMDISESGIPLWGRYATQEEIKAVKGNPYHILGVNEAQLGRNGLRHVIRSGSSWQLGSNGKRWLDILLAPSP